MAVEVDEQSCTGCGNCILSCPEGAVGNRPDFIARIDDALCTGCQACLDYCPNHALGEHEGG